MGEIALNVKHMNVKPGKQAMRDTNRNGQMQTLVLPDGRAKGLKMVLEEKGVDTTRMVADEMHETSSPFPDFGNHKILLEERVESCGHICLYFPKIIVN